MLFFVKRISMLNVGSADITQVSLPQAKVMLGIAITSHSSVGASKLLYFRLLLPCPPQLYVYILTRCL